MKNKEKIKEKELEMITRGPMYISNNSTERFTAYQFVRIGDRKFKFVFDVSSEQEIFVGILYFGNNGFSKMVDAKFLGKSISCYNITNRYERDKQMEVVKNTFNLFEDYLDDFIGV